MTDNFFSVHSMLNRKGKKFPALYMDGEAIADIPSDLEELAMHCARKLNAFPLLFAALKESTEPVSHPGEHRFDNWHSDTDGTDDEDYVTCSLCDRAAEERDDRIRHALTEATEAVSQ